MEYQLFHGSCIDILPTLNIDEVDVLLTDPPYGIDGGKGGDARYYGKGKYEALDGWDDTREYIGDVVVPAIIYILRHVKRAAITPGITNMDLYLKPSDVGCFWTPAAATHGPWGFTTFNPIFYYGKDPLAGKGALPSGTQVTEQAAKNGHPCPKPLTPWRWLLRKVSISGETVLDPFMGSGTTGVACRMEGRSFVGIELGNKYFAIAKKQIAQAQPPLLLAQAFETEPEQATLL